MDDLDLPEVPQGFAERFAAEAREPAELYLLSPPQIEADFADRLKAALLDLLAPLEAPLTVTAARPFVIMLAGVNGAAATSFG